MKLTKIITLLIVLCLAVCLCACNEDEESSVASSDVSSDVSSEASVESSEEVSEESEAAAFTVTIVDVEGNPVSGVMVQICKESCFPAKSDENGIAKFSIEITDGYKLSVTACPEGYVYNGDAEVYLESGATEYTITLDTAEVNE